MITNCERCFTDFDNNGTCGCQKHSIVNEMTHLTDFAKYQQLAYRTIKPHDSDALTKADWALGLGGEAGEVQELIKHNIMHKEPMDLPNLAKEVSDVLWYLAAISTTYGLRLDTIALLNIHKLQHRHGGVYSKDGSFERHRLDEDFTETEIYKQLMKRLFL